MRPNNLPKEVFYSAPEGELSAISGTGQNNFGRRNKGFLVVVGDAGSDSGFQNSNIIYISGDAGENLGGENKGTIIVEGSIESLHEKASGTIIASEVSDSKGRNWLEPDGRKAKRIIAKVKKKLMKKGLKKELKRQRLELSWVDL